MDRIKISQLPPSSELQGSEILPIVQDSTTKQVAYEDMDNKAYDPTNHSGLGYKRLKKNGGILTQSMISSSNTIYEIRYDYDLNGATITIPEGCVLEFKGGSLKNGTLVVNNTTLKGNINITADISGSVRNSYLMPEWFTSNINDYTQAIKTINNICGTIKLSSKDYYLHNITFENSIKIIGEGPESRLRPLDNEGIFITLSSRQIIIKDVWLYGSGMDIGNLDALKTTQNTWIEGTSRKLINVNIYKFSGTAITVPRPYNTQDGNARADITLQYVNIVECGNGIYYGGQDSSHESISIGYVYGYGITIDNLCNVFTDLRCWGTGRKLNEYAINITPNGSMTSIMNGRLQECNRGVLNIQAIDCKIDISEDDSYGYFINENGTFDFTLQPNYDITLINLNNAKYCNIKINSTMYSFRNYDKSILINGNNNSFFNRIEVNINPGINKDGAYLLDNNELKYFVDINLVHNSIFVNNINYNTGINVDFEKANISNYTYGNIAPVITYNSDNTYNINVKQQSTGTELISLQILPIFRGNLNLQYINRDITFYIKYHSNKSTRTQVKITVYLGSLKKNIIQRPKYGVNYLAVSLSKDDVKNLQEINNITGRITFELLAWQNIVNDDFVINITNWIIDLGTTYNMIYNNVYDSLNVIKKYADPGNPITFEFNNTFNTKSFIGNLSSILTYVNDQGKIYNIDIRNRDYSRSGIQLNAPSPIDNDLYLGYLYFSSDSPSAILNKNGIPVFYNGSIYIDSLGRDCKLLKIGNTSQRPILSNNDVGFEYFDTDLHQKLTWVGSHFVSYDGEIANIPRSGTYANRPLSTSTYPPTNVGFQYFNTDTHKMMFYGGSDIYYYADGKIATS